MSWESVVKGKGVRELGLMTRLPPPNGAPPLVPNTHQNLGEKRPFNTSTANNLGRGKRIDLWVIYCKSESMRFPRNISITLLALE